jgi:hypothetical protein
MDHYLFGRNLHAVSLYPSSECDKLRTMSEHPSSFEYVSTDSTPLLTSSHEVNNSRRRYALQYLAHFNYPVELRTLAAHVAAALTTVPVESLSDGERERVAIRLHHVDMPKLVAEGIVAYDPESRMVVRRDTVRTERYADASDRSRRSDAV